MPRGTSADTSCGKERSLQKSVNRYDLGGILGTGGEKICSSSQDRGYQQLIPSIAAIAFLRHTIPSSRGPSQFSPGQSSLRNPPGGATPQVKICGFPSFIPASTGKNEAYSFTDPRDKPYPLSGLVFRGFSREPFCLFPMADRFSWSVRTQLNTNRTRSPLSRFPVRKTVIFTPYKTKGFWIRARAIRPAVRPFRSGCARFYVPLGIRTGQEPPFSARSVMG